MKKTNMKKLTVAGIFCAVAVVGSLFLFLVFGSKCSPVQHMVNILAVIISAVLIYSLKNSIFCTLCRSHLNDKEEERCLRKCLKM